MNLPLTREPGGTVLGSRVHARLERPDFALLGLLLGAWALGALFVGVGGEFPENDSWAYFHTSERFLETGRLVRAQWTYAPIVTNVLVGTGFAQVFGLSFATLRASSLVMGAVGLLGVYVLARLLGSRRQPAALAAAAFGFAPLHAVLSFTYMTDVTYTALAVLSLAALCWGMQSKRWVGYGLGLGFAGLATLSRQTGIVIIAALLATEAIARVRSLRSLGVALLFCSGFAALAFALEHFVLGWSNLGVLRAMKTAFLGAHPLFTLAKHGLPALACLGLMSLPLLVVRVLQTGSLPPRQLLVGLAFGAITLGGILLRFSDKPFGGNMLDPGGIGPLILHCASERPLLPSWLWWSLVTLGALAGGVALAVLLSWFIGVAWPARSLRPELVLLPVYIVLYLVPVLLRYPFFDRYLVPVGFAWVALLALSTSSVQARRRQWIPGTVVAAVVGVLSLAASSDYLGHLRVRQALLDPLLQRGVSPEQIEGGFEFDGMHRYGHRAAKYVRNWSRERLASRDNAWLNRLSADLARSDASGWPRGDAYLLSFCPNVAGYRKAQSEARSRFLPPFSETLYLHEQTAQAP